MCSMKALEEEYRQNGYSLKTKLLGTVLETTKHHMYTEHVDGEPLEMYGYVGKNCKRKIFLKKMELTPSFFMRQNPWGERNGELYKKIKMTFLKRVW